VEDAPEGSYDVIIVDSSDPVGPAEVLFEEVRGAVGLGLGLGCWWDWWGWGWGWGWCLGWRGG